MNLNQTNRRGILCRNAFLLSLALLVFVWGLQYKLSLDSAPHSISRHIVEAKLLSGDDLGATVKSAAASLPSDPASVPPVTLLSTLLVSLVAVSLWGAWSRPVLRERVAVRPWRRPERATHGAFFFRPPPIL